VNNEKTFIPGVNRDDRLSEQGLQRLEKQLSSGAAMSVQVLAQWIHRYGEPARTLIKQYNQYDAELDTVR